FRQVTAELSGSEADAVVLDSELDLAIGLDGMDLDPWRFNAGEGMSQRVADRFGDDEANRDRRVGSDRHDRRANVEADIGERRSIAIHRQLTYQVVEEKLEIDQRPARTLVEVAMQ